MTAGMSSMRTMKASKRTPSARPRPIDLMITESEAMNPENTAIMMIAAAETTVRPARKPCATARRGDAPCAQASRIPVARNSW